MIKKTITYTDFMDIERTEEFCFNLSESELTKMELGVEGGLGVRLQKIAASKNGPEIMKMFEEIILKSYGEITEDGRGFNKSPEIANAFKHTAAYDVLYMELISDDKAATAFIKGIMPRKLAEKIDENVANQFQLTQKSE